MHIVHIDKRRYDIQEQKKIGFGIPANTNPFRAVVTTLQRVHWFRSKLCVGNIVRLVAVIRRCLWN